MMENGHQLGRVIPRVVPSQGFQRASERYEVDATIQAQILIPEETFRPEEFRGRAIDMSMQGMKVCLHEFPLNFYNKLLTKTRYIRIQFENPFSGVEIKITGRIVSIDYHKPHATQRTGICFFGVHFDQADGADLTEYTSFIDELIRQ